MDKEFVVEGINVEDFETLLDLLNQVPFYIENPEKWNKALVLKEKIKMILDAVSD